MFRIRYERAENGDWFSEIVLDNRAETFYQVIIQQSHCVQWKILSVADTVIYCETAQNVTDAKRNAKKKLLELGVSFKKEIRFKKNENLRRKLYRTTRG